jgi:hypothetical protein
MLRAAGSTGLPAGYSHTSQSKPRSDLALREPILAGPARYLMQAMLFACTVGQAGQRSLVTKARLGETTETKTKQRTAAVRNE